MNWQGRVVFSLCAVFFHGAFAPNGRMIAAMV
jgi:hypothetical protein